MEHKKYRRIEIPNSHFIKLCEDGLNVIVKYLLEDAERSNIILDIFYNDGILMDKLCQKNNVSIITMLFEYGNKYNIKIDNKKFMNILERIYIYDGIIKYFIDYSNTNNIHIDMKIIRKIFKYSCIDGHTENVKYLIEYTRCKDYNIVMDTIDDECLRAVCNIEYIEILKLLINSKINIDIINSNLINLMKCDEYITLIDILIRKCDTSVFIDINANNEYAFITACKEGLVDIVKLIIKYGIEHDSEVDIHIMDDEAFRIACENSQFEVIKYLLEYCEINNSKIDVYKCLNKDKIKNKHPAFQYICCSDNLELVRFICEYIDTHNITHDGKVYINSLYTACWNSSIQVINYLLEYYKNKNIKINSSDIEELIIKMCIKNRLDVIILLIEYCKKNNIKFNIHAQNDNAFIQAGHNKNIHITEYLLKYGDDNNCKFIKCLSDAFARACNTQNIEFLKLIIRYCNNNNIIIDLSDKINVIITDIFTDPDIYVLNIIIEYFERINVKYYLCNNKYIDINKLCCEAYTCISYETIDNNEYMINPIYVDAIKYIVNISKHNYDIKFNINKTGKLYKYRDLCIAKNMCRNSNTFKKFKYIINNQYVFNCRPTHIYNFNYIMCILTNI